MSGAYFTYELVDPRDGSVFYVGKGQRARPRQHRNQAMAGKHSAKCQRIRAIINDGFEYDWRIVKRFWSEQDAYDAEAVLICDYGLENLTNVLPGGGKAWDAYQSEQGKRQPTSEQLVVQHHKALERALFWRVVGAHVKLKGGDHCFVRGGSDLAIDLLRKVGDAFFFQHVKLPPALVSNVKAMAA